MALSCTGNTLPNIVKIPIKDPPSSLDDFCLVFNEHEEILLYEKLTDSKHETYYWAIVEVDEYSVAACLLEEYADYASGIGQWSGRRSDYLLIGLYNWECYVIVVELRHVLVREQQEKDKFEQLRQSLAQIIDRITVLVESEALSQIYEEPEVYKFAGVVIAPGNTRSFNRRELNPQVTIAGHEVLIRTLPKDSLSDCRITWTKLLKRLGVPIEIAC